MWGAAGRGSTLVLESLVLILLSLLHPMLGCVGGTVEKARGKHFSWKHIATLAGSLLRQGRDLHQTIKAHCLSDQILSATLGMSLSVLLFRVCLFWRCDGAAASVIRCRPMYLSFLTAWWHISIGNSLHTPTCLSFLTARWRISIRIWLHATVSVFSDGTRQRVCLFWRHDGVSTLVARRTCLSVFSTPMSSICLYFWPLLLQKDSRSGTMRETCRRDFHEF